MKLNGEGLIVMKIGSRSIEEREELSSGEDVVTEGGVGREVGDVEGQLVKAVTSEL